MRNRVAITEKWLGEGVAMREKGVRGERERELCFIPFKPVRQHGISSAKTYVNRDKLEKSAVATKNSKE